MVDETFAVNLMRMIAAEMHVSNLMTASREMFGRSYFSLGNPERMAVDQAIVEAVGANYKPITPSFLSGQENRPAVGFPTRVEPQSSESS